MALERIVAMSVNLDLAQDRVCMDCQYLSERRARLWMTRRMSRRLLQRLSGWLARANAIAAQVHEPTLRREVLQMEHQRQRQAVATENRDAPRVRPTPGGPDAEPGLVTGIGFAELANGRYAVGFALNKAADASVEVRFTQAQVHWWVGRVVHLARQAEWDFAELEQGWLVDTRPAPAQSGPLH